MLKHATNHTQTSWQQYQMNKEIEILKNKRKEIFLKIIKDYLYPPIIISILALFLHFVFQVSFSINSGVIIGIWLGTLMRFLLFDFQPSYVYCIDNLNQNLILYLINPIGKTKELKYSLKELDSLNFKKKPFWKAYDKIYIQKNGLVRNYNVVDSQLMTEYQEIQKTSNKSTVANNV